MIGIVISYSRKMSEIFSTIQNTLTDSIRMSILHTTQKTSMYETIVLSILISALSYLGQYATNLKMPISKYHDGLKSVFYRKYVLRIEGKTSTSTSIYSRQTHVTSIYTDKFKAMWSFIIKNLSKNQTIHQIREVPNIMRIKVDDDDYHDKNKGMYIVSQAERFLLDADLEIYASANERNESSDEKGLTQLNMYELSIYSYKSNTNVLTQFVEKITEQYLSELTETRTNKRFMYSLTKSGSPPDQVTSWNESVFHSSKTFQNVFFEHKEKVLAQIDFFLQNREWYDTYGIPYTLGIGLYGPPGTGKTSFIKALMNHVNDRHLINMPISIIQTKSQLHEYYYESRFCELNRPNSIGFDKKIIIIEDIDCAGDIVMERNPGLKPPLPVTANNISDEYCDITLNERLHTLDTDIQKSVKEQIVAETQKIVAKMTPPSEDRITLDDILNLWDGIRETPGRILVITSNHYAKLDTAIRRPGRIDITLGMENASREIIADMFMHFYNKPVDTELLSKIDERLYSPAEIVNIYTAYKTDDVGFMKRLCENRRI